MTSLRHQLVVALLKATRRRRIYASVEGLHAGIAQTRQTGPDLPGPALSGRIKVERKLWRGHPHYTLSPRTTGATTLHLLYLHGGAYVRPITRFHWRLLAELVERTGCQATVPLYPLAPESDCERTLAHVREVHAQLLETVPPQELVLAGDSAGGGLTLALALSLQRDRVPVARRLVLISPAVDMSLTGADLHAVAQRDPMLALDGLREAGRLYAGSWPVEHPFVSPLRAATLAGLPPTTLFVGTRDLLGPDALRLSDRLRDHGCEVQLHLGHEMIHVWPLLPTPEGSQAREQLAAALMQQ